MQIQASPETARVLARRAAARIDVLTALSRMSQKATQKAIEMVAASHERAMVRAEQVFDQIDTRDQDEFYKMVYVHIEAHDEKLRRREQRYAR